VTDKVVVLVACGSLAEARRIAGAVVGARLAACVNIIPGAVRSIYRWRGKIETANERLLLIKTSRGRQAKLRATVERLHSYRIPEIIALPVSAGSPGYLAWLDECLADAPRRKGKPGKG
jgi:periplasmic divalent cation tolerance protein